LVFPNPVCVPLSSLTRHYNHLIGTLSVILCAVASTQVQSWGDEAPKEVGVRRVRVPLAVSPHWIRHCMRGAVVRSVALIIVAGRLWSSASTGVTPGPEEGSVTLVLLPLKYEIDDSVTVTVVLLWEAGRCTLFMGGTKAYR